MAVENARDIQLMGRIAAGDRGAFAELFDRHGPVVLGVLTRMMRRREIAEELLQEAFLQAWREAGRYRPERATPRGWLIMLARSRALDALRSSSSRRQREQAVAPREAAEQPVGTAGLEAEQDRTRVHGALERLSPEQRRCIELAFWEGLSHRQVAERLEQPLGTVKSRILLGMHKLREALST